jgi:parvulin-like peptidyl-prolyl isomerase
MYFGKSIDDKKEITFDRMLSFYNQNKEEFKREPKTEFQLIHIRKDDDKVKALETAQKALQDIEEGKDFTACVESYSQGIKAASGGLWQTADPSSFIPPYDRVVEAIADMREGEVSGVIDADEHIFIVKLLENTEAGYIPFKDVQKDIKQYIETQHRREQVEKLLEELFEQANIPGLEGFLQYCIQQIYIRGKAK